MKWVISRERRSGIKREVRSAGATVWGLARPPLEPVEAGRGACRYRRQGRRPVGECHRGSRRRPFPGLLAGHVVGVLELAQVRDQVAGRQPDHLCKWVTTARHRRGVPPALPRSAVAREWISGSSPSVVMRLGCGARSSQAARRCIRGARRSKPMPSLSHTPRGPAKRCRRRTSTSAIDRAQPIQSSRAAARAASESAEDDQRCPCRRRRRRRSRHWPRRSSWLPSARTR